MLEFLGSLIGPIISGIVSAVSAVLLMMNRYQDKLEKLSGAIEHLKTERVNKLEITVTEHIKEDKSQRTETILERLEGTMEKVDNKIDVQGEAIVGIKATQETQFAAHGKWLENMDDMLQCIQQNKRRRTVKR